MLILETDSETAVRVVVVKIFQEHARAHNEPNTDLKTGLSYNSKRRVWIFLTTCQIAYINPTDLRPGLTDQCYS